MDLLLVTILDKLQEFLTVGNLLQNFHLIPRVKRKGYIRLKCFLFLDVWIKQGIEAEDNVDFFLAPA